MGENANQARKFALFPVAERFVSINGEGQHAGRLAAFIRFAGCNLECSYCDTQWAQEEQAATEFLTAQDLAQWVACQPCSCVTLTGGEPTLQPWLFSLVEQLSALPSIEVVEIETNGSQRLDVLAASRTKKLTFTMDYKLPSSGMEGRMCTENFAVLGATDVVKFVAGSREDLETMARVVGEYNLTTRCKVYVSPVFGEIEPAEIVEFLKDRSLDQVVLQLQLHKIIWPNQEKGV